MQEQIHAFQNVVWDYYDAHGRHDLPWRLPNEHGLFDPYAILVSEIMLQQTQVARVMPKYEAFLQRFPTVGALAAAPLADVLTLWSGLGYNRRAKFLWQAAHMVDSDMDGVFPQTVDELVKLPGVGRNTAGAIAAYAFNRPVIFIETNIRTVFIHHFFADETDVTDKQLEPPLHQTIDEIVAINSNDRSPRLWYWALMDYGTYLKQTVGNVSRQSKTYAKQSAFEGSKRQIRGHVLRLLATQNMTRAMLAQQIIDDRLDAVLDDLLREEFVTRKDEHYHLGSA